MAEAVAADDEADDGSACAVAHDLSGSQLRCAQLRPLGIPMGLQGHHQRDTVRDSKRCCNLIMTCGECYANDNALAASDNADKTSSVVSASSSSLDAAVATCILHADVAAAACLLQLLLVLLLLTYDADESCRSGDDHHSGSLLRCAQQRALGIPMGLQGYPRSPPEMRNETLNEML